MRRGDLRTPDVTTKAYTGGIAFNSSPAASADRTLTVDLQNGSRTLDISADTTLSGSPYTPGGTDVAVADGGTGASTAATARTNLGLPVAGSIVQVVNAQTSAAITCNTIIPYDDTIPQNTEGTEAITLAITPTNAANKLRIDLYFNLQCNGSSSSPGCVALFQDSTANALAAFQAGIQTTGYCFNVAYSYYMTAGTTSATTFKVRIGASTGGYIFYVNANSSGTRVFGGASISGITITEIAA